MQVKRLVDLADTESVIRDQVISDAVIVGPGVVTILGDVKFDRSVFEGDPTVLFIEVPQTKRQIGVVALENVTFTRCRFQNVAIIGTPRAIAELKTQLQGEGAPELHLSGATGPAASIAATSYMTGSIARARAGGAATASVDPRPPERKDSEPPK
jgi:hypothetical protein